MPYIGRSTEAFGVRSRFTFLASADDTSVSGNDVNGLPLSFTDGAYVDVFLNGVRLKHNTDYVTTTANTISSLAALAANDEIEVVVFDVFSLADMVSSANGGNFFSRVNFKSDSAVLGFGADNDVTLTHVADTGLILKNTSTTGNSGIGAVLTLQTGDTDIAAGNILGKIEFQAPDEGTGTDAILVAAGIEAQSEGDFSSSSNATTLIFKTGSSETATEKFRIESSGSVGIAADGSTSTNHLRLGAGADLKIFHDGTNSKIVNGTNALIAETADMILKDTSTSDGSSATLVLQTGDTDIAQDDVLGTINFQAPDEGTGTDAILVAAGISAISEGDFSSSSNATKLSFKTGASETAVEKMALSSGGDLSLVTDGAAIKFGADSEITLTHSADAGLLLKHANTADDKFPTLTLQTGDTDIAQGDVLGRIAFQAPDEGTGTDAITVPVNIEAVSQGDFSSSNNATSLIINTSVSAAAGTAGDGGKFSFIGNGEQIIKSMATGDDNYPVLSFQTGETDIAQDDILGFISFSAPDEATGSDANLISAAIAAVSEGDFSSSSNATTLELRTGASEAATAKLKVKSDGDVEVVDGDLVIGTGQHGIDFASAAAGTGDTGGAETSTATILDDYEEGTFTVSSNSVFAGSGTLTEKGMYVKIGQLVNCSIRFTPSGGSTNAHQFGFYLPFKAGTTEATGSFNSWTGAVSFSAANGTGQNRVFVLGGDTNFGEVKVQNSTGIANVAGNTEAGNVNLSFSITYRTID